MCHRGNGGLGLLFFLSENVLLCSAAFDPGQGTVEDVCTNISVRGPSIAGCLKFHLEWPFRAAAVRVDKQSKAGY